MSEAFDIRRAAHAGSALALLFVLVFAAAAVGGAAWATIAGKLSALEARRESAAALEARIEEFRAETREKLGLIGASEKDAIVVASPDQMHARLADICAALSQQIGGACAVEEAPLSPSLALYRATINANGAIPAMTDALEAAATSPIRISGFTLKPGAGGSIDLRATLEIAGARAASEAE